MCCDVCDVAALSTYRISNGDDEDEDNVVNNNDGM